MRKWVIFALAAIMLSGCQMQHGKDESLGRPVIQKIVVTEEQRIKTFTSEEKMQTILHKIRRLGQKFTPDVDPEGQPGELVCIELYRSDGTGERYMLKGDRFIRKGDQPWQQTESRLLLRLIGVLEELPPDS